VSTAKGKGGFHYLDPRRAGVCAVVYFRSFSSRSPAEFFGLVLFGAGVADPLPEREMEQDLLFLMTGLDFRIVSVPVGGTSD